MIAEYNDKFIYIDETYTQSTIKVKVVQQDTKVILLIVILLANGS